MCPYCGTGFPTANLREFHLWQRHAEELSDAERERITAAYEAEQTDLREFRMKALAALVLLYFGFLLAYAGFAS